MSALSFTASAMAQSFSYALLYSLWQGFLIFGILFVLLKALPGMSARAKYYLSYSSLVAVFIWFADTWIGQYSKLRGVTVYISGAVNNGIVGNTSVPVITTSTSASPDIFQRYLPQVEQYVPLIVLAYCVGLAFMMLRFIINMVQLRSLEKNGVWMPGSNWMGYVRLWQQHLGIDRPVKLLVSERVDVPMMFGMLRPLILLPIATVNNLSTEQVEAIILHELAHIKRHDYLLNLLQTVVETILFFNPFVWLISSVIRREREHCCDDLVVACAANPMHYAKALAMLEDNRINNSLTLAATGNKNQLFHRIKRIMEMKKENTSHGRLSVILVAVIALIFLSATISFTPSFAQKSKDKKKPQTNTTIKTITIDDNGKKNVVTKTTHSSSGKKDDDEDFDINISVDDAGTNRAVAHIVVSSDDKNGGKGTIRNVKKIVVTSNGNNASTTVINRDKLDEEIANVQKEIDAVDWDEIREEINKALAEVDKEVNVDKMSKEITYMVKKELEKSKEQLAEAKGHKVVAMASTKGSGGKTGSYEIQKGSDELEVMLKKMEKDGLIDRSSKFEIEKNDKGVFINNKKQPETIVERYPYLRGKTVAITGIKDDINVAVFDW